MEVVSGVLNKLELPLIVTKKKNDVLWLISSYESQLTWKGEGVEIEIYHKNYVVTGLHGDSIARLDFERYTRAKT